MKHTTKETVVNEKVHYTCDICHETLLGGQKPLSCQVCGLDLCGSVACMGNTDNLPIGVYTEQPVRALWTSLRICRRCQAVNPDFGYGGVLAFSDACAQMADVLADHLRLWKESSLLVRAVEQNKPILASRTHEKCYMVTIEGRNLVERSRTSKAESVPYAETKYGFDWGAVKITRCCSIVKKGIVILRLETPMHKESNALQIYVTKSGKVRIHGTGGEWRPPNKPEN